jgi:hypothetical protein
VIDQGHDAFVINRRTIGEHYASPDELPMIWSDIGEPHPGFDCFVFPRSAYEKYQLGSTCIGTRWTAEVLLVSLICHARHFKEFTDLHATFHVGNYRVWSKPELADYYKFNEGEFRRMIEAYRESGVLSDHRWVNQYISVLAKNDRIAQQLRAFFGIIDSQRPASGIVRILLVQSCQTGDSFWHVITSLLDGVDRIQLTIATWDPQVRESFEALGHKVSILPISLWGSALLGTCTGKYDAAAILCMKQRHLKLRFRSAAKTVGKARVQIVECDPDV